MKTVIKLALLALLTGVVPLFRNTAHAVSPQQANEILAPYQKLTAYQRAFPEQKVYIHTDKADYLAGEAIWLKAYLISARTHVPDTFSTNLFVELINNRDEVVDFLILRLDRGYAYGHIQLSDSILGGSYQLKAYTNWMNNFDKDFIFLKDIYVKNPYESNYVTRAEIRQNNRFNASLEEKQSTFQFAFFPEGGYLVAGLENRMAFKAADAFGRGCNARGVLIDGQGNELLEFTTIHDGMGIFAFTPEPGEYYQAKVEFSNGQTLSVPVPAAFTQGYLLRLDNERDYLKVQIQANFDPASINMSSDFLLVAHTRGQVCFVEQASFKDGNFMTKIPADRFPRGIAHFTLFDPNDTPVAERLTFVGAFPGREEAPTVNFEVSSADSLIIVDLHVDLAAAISPSEASYSFSALEKYGEINDDGQNIATYLLLISDFGSTIYNPWYYFAEDNPIRRQALDLLMMTHGWRRFVWQDLLTGKEPEVLFEESKGLTLAGQVTPVSSARETGELGVEISVGYLDDRQIMKTKTDNQGYFAFTGLDFEGPFTALLSVGHDRRGRIYKVNLSGSKHETTSFIPGLNTRPQQTLARGPNWKRRERPGFFSRLVNRPGTGEETKTPSMFGIPDQVIYIEDLNVNYTNVYDILRDRVTGLRIINGEITLRGPSSIRFSNEPVFFVDEVQVNPSLFFSVSVHEIERIEVLRGPNTAILGSRGANGALLIYTRRAEHQHQYSYEYHLRGYHVKQDFFMSKISTQEYMDQEVPRTLLWIPDLTLDKNGRVRVRIPYLDDPGLLHFRLEGVDHLGQIIFLQL